MKRTGYVLESQEETAESKWPFNLPRSLVETLSILYWDNTQPTVAKFFTDSAAGWSQLLQLCKMDLFTRPTRYFLCHLISVNGPAWSCLARDVDQVQVHPQCLNHLDYSNRSEDSKVDESIDDHTHNIHSKHPIKTIRLIKWFSTNDSLHSVWYNMRRQPTKKGSHWHEVRIQFPNKLTFTDLQMSKDPTKFLPCAYYPPESLIIPRDVDMARDN